MLVLAFLVIGTLRGPADQVQLQNGDQYNGKVLSLDDKTLILENEVLGKIALPRGKIAVVLLGPQPVRTHTNPAATSGGLKQTNSLATDLASHSNLIQQVQRQFLAGADPQAQQKFNSLVSGLLDGSITLEDVQREARTAADQVRALKKELGPEASSALDGYLAILDQFLKEAPDAPAPTNSPPPKVSPRNN